MRLKFGFHDGVTDATLTDAGNTLESSSFVALPEVASGDHLALVLDPEAINGAPEIVWVTAHTASSNEVTVDRAQEGSTARAHPAGTVWAHGPTVADGVTQFTGSHPTPLFVGQRFMDVTDPENPIPMIAAEEA